MPSSFHMDACKPISCFEILGTCQLESNLESLRYVVEYAQLRDNLLTQPVEVSCQY